MRPQRAAILAAGALAALASVWLLFGLRHTSHDDHYFEVLAHHPDVGLAQATLWVAGFGRRVAHLLNVPTSVISHRIMNLPGALGDVALLAQLALILGGFGLVLRRFAGGAAAVGWAMALMGGYALHWYFMPPLTIPLHALNSVMLLAVSLFALDRHLVGAGRAWLGVALAASGIGILWPEFNFLLYPLATFGLILLHRPGWRASLRVAWPFLLVWALLVAATIGLRPLIPAYADEARMTVVLDPPAWAAAFGTLLGKAVLPVALLMGIDLQVAAVPGMPGWPRQLDWPLLLRVLAVDWPGFALVTLLWTGGFLLVLRHLAPGRLGLWVLLGGGVAMLVIPVGVVALSAEYQRILRLGYIQGAVASAHAQAGFLTILFAAAALLARRWPRWLVQGVLALMLGALCALTLAYNLMMRDVKAANQQRWLAFALMAEALPEGASLRAPSLWANAGVSAIPAQLPFGMAGYWTERARIWHGKRITVLAPDAPAVEGEAFAAHGVRPEGGPLVLLRQGATVELLARRPMPVDSLPLAGASWRCDGLCRLRVPPDADATPLLRPMPQAHRGLFRWWLAPREGGFGGRASWP